MATTNFCQIRVETRTQEGGSNWEDTLFRVHDAAGSQLNGLFGPFTLFTKNCSLVVTPITSSMPFLEKLTTKVTLWINDSPAEGFIYEREFQLDPSRYAKNGRDLREGERYLFIYDPNSTEPSFTDLTLGLVRLLGIGAQIPKLS